MNDGSESLESLEPLLGGGSPITDKAVMSSGY